MTHEPRTIDDIYEELRDGLKGRIAKLTNFTETSFNFVWTRAFATEVRELELRALNSEFAGWVDYAGGPITEDDLERLGIEDSVTPEELESFTDDENLEELVKIVGVERDEGSPASGTVDIETDVSRDVTITEGIEVATEPDLNGASLTYEVTYGDDESPVESPSGQTTAADVPIEAVEVSTEYNVPANTISRFPSPPIGLTGVNNPESVDGGREAESNDSLRDRAKNAVLEQAGGGTVEGIRGFVISNVEGLNQGDVLLEEFTDPCPPYVDVIVDGGTESEVLDAIEQSRPVAIKHNLVRPEVTQIGVDAALNGTDVNDSFVRQEIEDYLLELGLGEPFYEDEVIRRIMNSDNNILNIEQLRTTIDRATNETFTFDDTVSTYELQYTYADNGNITVVDDSGDTYEEDTDFQVVSLTTGGNPKVIDWSINAVTPDDEELFFVDYDVQSPANIVRDETNTMNFGLSDTFTYDPTTEDFYRLSEVPFDSSVSISGFTKGTDYTVESRPEDDVSDTFVYLSGKDDYRLDYTTSLSTETVTDEGGTTYSQGSDYDIVDTDGDGRLDTLRWLGGGSSPAADSEFTIEYQSDNYIPQSIVWDTNESTPNSAEQFTVNYDQAFYDTQYEIVDAPDDVIEDETTATYTEDTEYEFADYSADGENDGVLWIDGQTTPSGGEDFYLTYTSEGNRVFEVRQKADPGSVTVTTQ